jgi:hypothetical protein
MLKDRRYARVYSNPAAEAGRMLRKFVFHLFIEPLLPNKPRGVPRAIPPFSPYLYRFRNLVERFFNQLKHFRPVATRFENTMPTISRSSISLPPEFGCDL